VERLLEMERVREAEDVSSQASDYLLLGLADLFVAHGQPDTAERLVRARLPNNPDSRLMEWLKEYLTKTGKPDEALTLSERLFWLRPSTPGYEAIRKIAQPLHRWDELRQQVLDRLGDQKQFALLTEIYILEKEIGLALDSYARSEQVSKAAYPWWLGSFDLQIRLAEAAEVSHPQDAIRLYLAVAEQMIGQRNRGAYAEAAQYLARIYRIDERLGDLGEWKTLISRIREQYKRLPALIDELGKAKLV
jgi:hypothetical protein